MKCRRAQKYYLGTQYPGVYFTQREVDCLMQLLSGYTIIDIANTLLLSLRTVEFYVKNMRTKVAVSNKSELIKKIRKINFLNQREFQYNRPSFDVNYY